VGVLGVGQVGEQMEGIRIPQTVNQFAALAAAIGVVDDGIDLPDVGVDAETEEDHLQERNDQGKKERGEVAPHMEDLFIKNRTEAAKETTHERPPAWLDVCW